MSSRSLTDASVLIVDSDPAVRGVVDAVLKHAGFQTTSVADIDDAGPLLATSDFAVIVRDLNLEPSEGRRNLQQLAATPPDQLRRTIVMTTARSRAENAIAAAAVFAIVGKPFDIHDLVNTVGACARGSRTDRHAPRRTHRPRRAKQSDLDTDPLGRLESLQRFVRTVPGLQHLLSVPVSGQREALLRTEMRRTLASLSAVLQEGAGVETDTIRAAVFAAASTVAAQLATVSGQGTAAAARRDH